MKLKIGVGASSPTLYLNIPVSFLKKKSHPLPCITLKLPVSTIFTFSPVSKVSGLILTNPNPPSSLHLEVTKEPSLSLYMLPISLEVSFLPFDLMFKSLSITILLSYRLITNPSSS